MAGRKGMKGGGGSREGSGRKRVVTTPTDRLRKNFQAAARKLKKEHGKSPEEIMLEKLYDPGTSDLVKASIFKVYTMANVDKSTTVKGDHTVRKAIGPTIGLPPKHETEEIE